MILSSLIAQWYLTKLLIFFGDGLLIRSSLSNLWQHHQHSKGLTPTWICRAYLSMLVLAKILISSQEIRVNDTALGFPLIFFLCQSCKLPTLINISFLLISGGGTLGSPDLRLNFLSGFLNLLWVSSYTLEQVSPTKHL